ncbi:MAG TPA: Hsp20/alpha crystallin family protein [Gemmatimonadales bacterium]|nr:Hsp20/alpha crystallin family protein [Gemmatimonadales bacterium]
MPFVDIFEAPEYIRLVAEVPGVKPEEVKIFVEGNLLTIKGTKEQVAEEKA